jgi:prepilin-type N-terminal cleavage/methylation domain-containing protein
MSILLKRVKPPPMPMSGVRVFSGGDHFYVEEPEEMDWLECIPPMHTLARFPAREARLNDQAGNRAFTLIELLTVIAIIAILAGITFGVIKGVNERAAISQAKAELSVLAQSLENYKRQYGDYPQIAIDNSTGTNGGQTSGERLYKALNGQIGPKLGASDLTTRQRVFFEKTKFTLVSPAATDLASNYIIDPWGRAYRYAYKSAGWLNPSYLLFSVGPDGEMTSIPSDGVLSKDGYDYFTQTKSVGGKTLTVNADNIISSK